MRTRSGAEALLLDEMFVPSLAEALRSDGFDVVSVAGHALLAAGSDQRVATWAAREGRRIVTENVRDFAALVGRGEPPLRVLFASSRCFPRSRRNPGPLRKALRRWLEDAGERPVESWLR